MFAFPKWMVIRMVFDGVVLYAEKRYDPETQKDVFILMDEAELRRQETQIREYVRRLAK